MKIKRFNENYKHKSVVYGTKNKEIPEFLGKFADYIIENIDILHEWYIDSENYVNENYIVFELVEQYDVDLCIKNFTKLQEYTLMILINLKKICIY